MKKITSLLVTCFLAGGAMAQQSEDKPDPKHKKGKGHNTEEKAGRAGEASPAAPAEAKKAPKAEKREGRQTSAQPSAPAEKKHAPRQDSDAAPAKKSANPPASKKHAAPKAPVEAAQVEQAPDARKESVETTSKAAKKRGKAQRDNRNNETARSAPDVSERSKNSEVRPTDSQPADNTAGKRQAKTRAANARRPAPEKVQEIRAKHESFRAEARPDRVPSVTFSDTRRIENSDRWQGPQYEVFRSYRPERHDQSYYHSHYDRVELFAGGYYYQRNNYWYPAWGYQPANEYYAYDGPIYAGRRADPPDRVIADVQDALLDLGYYKGEVDGLLGPLTRGALTGYQNDEGLEPTAAIDEPTLDALGLQ